MTRNLILAASILMIMVFQGHSEPAVLVEAENDTVTKFIYIGSSPTSTTHPAVSVEGKALGIKAVAENTNGAVALVGQVAGASLPNVGSAKAGVLGASETYGVMGKGSVGIHGDGSSTGVMGVSSSTGGTGVTGVASGGAGISGASTDGAGVVGTSSDWVGVIGQSTTSHGIKGVTSAYYQHAVRGEGPGSAVYGISTEFGGVYGTVTSDGLYGTVGYVSNDNQYAVYGQVGGSTTGSYAGYFQGNVVVNGLCNPCSPSDTKFKKNIRTLEGGLQKVMALRPKTYEMKTEEFKESMNFAAGLNYGMLAEDVAEVLPELVHQVKSPPKMDAQGMAEKNGERVDFQAISYSHLIPILVKAIQEQQARIEALEAQLQGR